MTSVRRSQIEQMVLDALRHNLMQPEAVQESETAFTAEWNRLAAEQNSHHAQDKTRLASIQTKINRIVEAITDGFRTSEMRIQLDELNWQKEIIQAHLSSPQAPTPSLHPNLVTLYRGEGRVITRRAEGREQRQHHRAERLAGSDRASEYGKG